MSLLILLACASKCSDGQTCPSAQDVAKAVLDEAARRATSQAAEGLGGSWNVVITRDPQGTPTVFDGESAVHGPASAGAKGAPASSTEGIQLGGGTFPFVSANPAEKVVWEIKPHSVGGAVPDYPPDHDPGLLFDVRRCPNDGCGPIVSTLPSTPAAPTTALGVGSYKATSTYKIASGSEWITSEALLLVRGDGDVRHETWCFHQPTTNPVYFYWPSKQQKQRAGAGPIREASLRLEMTSSTAPAVVAGTAEEECNALDGNAGAAVYLSGARFVASRVPL